MTSPSQSINAPRDAREHCLGVTRRHFLRDCGIGLGKIALAGLLTDSIFGRSGASAAADILGDNPLAPRKPHFAPTIFPMRLRRSPRR